MTAEPLPLPFRMRSDLQVALVEGTGEPRYVVKDPISLRYFHLPKSQFVALQSLGGSLSLADWGQRVEPLATMVPSGLQLQIWLQEFIRWGLVTRERWLVRPDASKRRPTGWHPVLKALAQPLYVQFPGIDPAGILRGLERTCGWLCTPSCVGLSLLFAAIVWLQTLAQFEAFQRRLPGWETLQAPATWCSIWLAIGFSKIIHELAHGLVARRWGAECHSLGAALVLFSPCLYCDVSDCWRLPRRAARIQIALAGIWAETVLGSLALALWWSTRPGWFHDWCWHLTAVSSLASVLINLNPLARYDGYFVCCDLLDIPNLKQQADARLNQLLQRGLCGRVDDVEAESAAKYWGLCAYALASAGYRLSIVVSMAWLLQALFAPSGLDWLMWPYLAIAGGTLVAGMTRRWWRIVRQRSAGLRPILISTLLVGLCGFSADWAATQPLRWPESAPFQVVPAAAELVFVSTSGILIETPVHYGEQVAAGEIIAVLRDPQLELERMALLVRCATQEQEVEFARVEDLPGGRQDAEAVLETLAAQLSELSQRRERLVIRAPIGGRLVAPAEFRDDHTAEPDAERLGTWRGYALDAENIQSWLDAGTELAVIVPSETPRALVQLAQRQRPHVEIGMSLELQPEGQPRERFLGSIAEIATRTLRPTRPDTSDVSGMPHSDSQGTIPVTVVLNETARHWPIGSTGTVRLWSSPQTPWDRLQESWWQATPLFW